MLIGCHISVRPLIRRFLSYMKGKGPFIGLQTFKTCPDAVIDHCLAVDTLSCGCNKSELTSNDAEAEVEEPDVGRPDADDEAKR